MFLDITLNTSSILEVLGWLTTMILAIIGAGVRVATVFHKQMMIRLDRLDADVKPLVITIALHDQDIREIKEVHIKEIKEEQHEINKWLGNHDGRIQSLERGIKSV